jgi:hypothetical protein
MKTGILHGSNSLASHRLRRKARRRAVGVSSKSGSRWGNARSRRRGPWSPEWADATRIVRRHPTCGRSARPPNRAELIECEPAAETPGAMRLRAFLCAEHERPPWRWKSSTQPDGGEGLAKRKGVIARCRLKEAWSKTAARWTRSRQTSRPGGCQSRTRSRRRDPTSFVIAIKPALQTFVGHDPGRAITRTATPS